MYDPRKEKQMQRELDAMFGKTPKEAPKPNRNTQNTLMNAIRNAGKKPEIHLTENMFADEAERALEEENDRED
jgi:hypothetical protein